MDRPTTTTTGVTLTRPACPPWCTHRDFCEGGSFVGPEHDTFGTARGVDEQGQAVRVTTDLRRDASTFGRDAIAVSVDLDHQAHLTVNEAQDLVAALTDLIETAKGTQPTPAPVVEVVPAQQCPGWCDVDHSTDVLVAGEGPAHSLTLLNTSGAEAGERRMVQVMWAPAEEVAPWVWVDFEGVDMELTPVEARVVAAAMTRAIDQPEVTQALLQAAFVAETTVQVTA